MCSKLKAKKNPSRLGPLERERERIYGNLGPETSWQATPAFSKSSELRSLQVGFWTSFADTQCYHLKNEALSGPSYFVVTLDRCTPFLDPQKQLRGMVAKARQPQVGASRKPGIFPVGRG